MGIFETAARNAISRRDGYIHDWPDWSDRPCVVVASGPSAVGCDLSLVRGRVRVVTVNTSFRLCPWADAFYANDFMWWDVHGAELERTCGAGLRVAAAPPIRRGRRFRQLRAIAPQDPPGFSSTPGRAQYMRNSGAHALGMAISLGVRRIVLVGFDMHAATGVHWHGLHAATYTLGLGEGVVHTLSNPTAYKLRLWADTLDAAAPSARSLGVEIVNASPDSALAAYPKLPWPEAVDWLLA